MSLIPDLVKLTLMVTFLRILRPIPHIFLKMLIRVMRILLSVVLAGLSPDSRPKRFRLRRKCLLFQFISKRIAEFYQICHIHSMNLFGLSLSLPMIVPIILITLLILVVLLISLSFGVCPAL